MRWIQRESMKENFLEIWDRVRFGEISMNEADEELRKLADNVDKTTQRVAKLHWPGRYKPEDGGVYHLAADPPETVYLDNYPELVESHRLNGVCCASHKEAEYVRKHKEAYLKLVDKIQELNNGWEPDWDDGSMAKFFFHYEDDLMAYSEWYTLKACKNELYFKSSEIGKQIIEELGEETIKLALWPEFKTEE